MTVGSWRASTVTGMASGRGPVPLRPLTVGDLLDEPFTLLRADLRTILLLTAVVVVPVQLLLAWVTPPLLGGLTLMEAVDDPMAALVAQDAGGTGLGPFAITALEAVLVTPLIVGLLSRLGFSRVMGEHLEAGQALRVVVRRAPALLAGGVLAGLAVYGLVLVGGFLAGIGGVVATLGGGGGGAVAGVLLGVLVLLAGIPVAIGLYVLLALVPVVIAVEGLGPIAGLRRSWRLMRHRYWQGLGVLLLTGLVVLLLDLALSGVVSAFAIIGGRTLGPLLIASGGIVAGLVTTPFQAFVLTLLYTDRRIRTEALDVEVAADVATQQVTSAGS